MGGMKQERVRWKDTVFHSAAEARWAVFLDGIGAGWEYRQKKAALTSGTFMPSFWLADWQIWLEVRPSGPDRAEKALARELCESTGYAVLLPDGLPSAQWAGSIFYLGAACGSWLEASCGRRHAGKEGVDAEALTACLDPAVAAGRQEGSLDGAAAVMEDLFRFSFAPAGGAPWIFVGQWERVVLFRTAGSAGEARFADASGRRCLCLYEWRSPLVYTDADRISAADCACGRAWIRDWVERVADRAGKMSFMSASPCGVAGPALAPGLDGMPGRQEASAVPKGLEDPLAGPRPEGTQVALARAGKAFSGLRSSREADVDAPERPIGERPKGCSRDVSCAGCCRGRFSSTAKGACRLACAGHGGCVPAEQKAWKPMGGIRLWRGASAIEGAWQALRAARSQAGAKAGGGPSQGTASKRSASWQPAWQETSESCAAAPPIPFIRTIPEAWPAPWQELSVRMKKGWLCWTYWELGEDLCREADPVRRRMLGQIIASLRRPAGTNTFWPCAVPAGAGPGQGALAASRDLFWSGARELGVRMVVAMGSRASAAIGLPKEEMRPLHRVVRNGVVLCMVWDFVRIAERPSRLGDVAAFLNAAFRQLRL